MPLAADNPVSMSGIGSAIDGALIANCKAEIAKCKLGFGLTRVAVLATCCVLCGCGAQPAAAPRQAAPAFAQPAPQTPAVQATKTEDAYLSDELPTGASSLVVVQTPPPASASISLPGPNKLVVAPDSVASVSLKRAASGSAKLPFSLVDEAAILADDASQHRPGRPTGPKATFHLFNSPAVKAHSFVFVIDRSASMGASGLGAIGAAAKELA